MHLKRLLSCTGIAIGISRATSAGYGQPQLYIWPIHSSPEGLPNLLRMPLTDRHTITSITKKPMPYKPAQQLPPLLHRQLICRSSASQAESARVTPRTPHDLTPRTTPAPHAAGTTATPLVTQLLMCLTIDPYISWVTGTSCKLNSHWHVWLPASGAFLRYTKELRTGVTPCVPAAPGAFPHCYPCCPSPHP